MKDRISGKKRQSVRTRWAYNVYSCSYCIRSESRTQFFVHQPRALAGLPYEVFPEQFPYSFVYYNCYCSTVCNYYYWKDDVEVAQKEYETLQDEEKDEWYKRKVQEGRKKMLDIRIRDMTYERDPKTNLNYVYEKLITCPSYRSRKDELITWSSWRSLRSELKREHSGVSLNDE